MQGTIQDPARPNGQGVIVGDDGATYTYTMLGWRDAATPAAPGMKVDFDVRGAHAVAIYPVPGALQPLINPTPSTMASQPPPATRAPSRHATHRQPRHLPTAGHVGSSPLAPGQQAPIPTPSHVGSTPFSPGQPSQIPTTGHIGSTPLAPGQPAQIPATGPVGSAPAAPRPYAQYPSGAVPPHGATTSRQPAQQSRTKLFIGVAAAVLAVGILSVGAFWYFQQPRSDEEIAAQVARDWTDSSIDDISELVMGLVVGNAPVVANLGANALAERIRERVAWSYSDPYCPREGRCNMTATANASFEINIPFVLDETVTVKVPFDLNIATDERRVANWDADIRSASVSGIELGGITGAAEAAVASSSDDIMRAVGKIRQIADDEGYAEVFEDASSVWDSYVDEDAWESFADEFDMDSVIDDVSDTWGSISDEYELESSFDDVSDTWDSFSDDYELDSTIDDVSDTWDSFSSDSDFESSFDDASSAASDAIGGLFGN